MSDVKFFEKVLTDGLQQIYKVTFPASVVESAIVAKARERAKGFKMDGFRPGHVPLPIVRSKFKDDINQMALESLVSDVCQSIIQESDIKELALRPTYKLESQFEEGKDINLTLTIEAAPVFELKPYDFEINKIIPKVTDENIIETRNEIMVNNPVYENAEEDHIIQIQDRVQYNAVYTRNGVQDKTRNIHNTVVVSEGPDSFMKELIGKKAGDIFELVLPNDQSIKYNVTIESVQKPIKDITPDDYAIKCNFQSLDEFNNAIKVQIENSINNQLYLYHKSQIIEALTKEYTFDLPKTVVEQEMRSILLQIRREQEAARKRGEEVKNKTDEELRNEYLDIVKKRVLLGYVFNKIAKQENISATDEELNNVIMNEINSTQNQAQMIIEHYRNNPALLTYKRAEITEHKVVSFLVSILKAKEEPKTLKETEQIIKQLLEEEDK